MVSVYPNPPPDQGSTHLYGFNTGGDPMNGMNRSDNDPVGNAGPGVDDPNKKIRKPYTITKSRESWSDQEHDKFLEALHLFDRDWKKIEGFVGSKTVIQIRSHAQKYFLKVQKNGTSEHVPPPRPKRKAAHPYPQKAPKNVVSQDTRHFRASVLNPIGDEPLSFSRTCNDDIGLASNYSSGSNESTPRVWKTNETRREVKECRTTKVIPDFAQVYGFIGSVFDPDVSDDHLKRLKKMDPIDIETVLLLMKNLCVNLASPEFEDHRKLLWSYNAGIEKDSVGSEIPSA